MNSSPTLQENRRGTCPSHARTRWSRPIRLAGEGLALGIKTLLLIPVRATLSLLDFLDAHFAIVYIKRLKGEADRYQIGYARTKQKARIYGEPGRLVFTLWTYRDELAIEWLEVLRETYQRRRTGTTQDLYRFTDKDLEKIRLSLRPYRLRPLALALYGLARSLELLGLWFSSTIGGEAARERYLDNLDPAPWPGTKPKK